LIPPDSVSEIDLKIENRQFIDITNENRIVPEPISGEFLREVYFKLSPDGTYTIKVSDLIMKKIYVSDPEIDEIVKETEAKSDKLKTHITVTRISSSMPANVFGNPYVGAEKCGRCHQAAFDSWKASAHAAAYKTLETKKKQDDPICLKCHVTQWSIKPAWYVRDWVFDKETTELSCESCHGAGKAHVNLIDYLSDPAYEPYLDEVRKANPGMHLQDLSIDADSICINCHDKKNSPDFDFKSYWEKIMHKQPDMANLFKTVTERKLKEKAEEALKNPPPIPIQVAPGPPKSDPDSSENPGGAK